MNIKPWEINPNLSKERIIAIANLITDVRAEVIERHDTELGDSPLSLGIRNYECCRNRIIMTAIEGSHDWLSIQTATGRFTFRLGKTPVRFVRNDPEQLPSEKLVPTEQTKHQMNLLSETDPYADIRWFFVIDTFYKNPADNAYFVGYNEHGEILCQWDIPIEDRSSNITVIGTQEEVKEVKKAEIKLKTINKKVVSVDD
jgi:hypothetical protein